MTVYIGIDPGKGGGIAYLQDPEQPDWFETKAEKMPATGTDVLDALEDYGRLFNSRAAIENVGAMPGEGRTSCFVFGRMFERVQMACFAVGLPFDLVVPSVWQKTFGLLKKKGETKTQKKNRHKEVAQRLFPHLKITHYVADSLLIAEWLRRKEGK